MEAFPALAVRTVASPPSPSRGGVAGRPTRRGRLDGFLDGSSPHSSVGSLGSPGSAASSPASSPRRMSELQLAAALGQRLLHENERLKAENERLRGDMAAEKTEVERAFARKELAMRRRSSGILQQLQEADYAILNLNEQLKQEQERRGHDIENALRREREAPQGTG